ncbi:MAG: pirin family protein [Cyanobacteria bacterium J06641_5]
MFAIRPAGERGRETLDWLDTRYTFSFSYYYDPNHLGFGPLRVINEDRIAPGHGFGTHGHRDMEIISYVLEGALAHKDSIGNGSTIRPGDVQCLSAGTGIMHSEFNASETESVHMLQIWIQPNQKRLEPSYEEIQVPTAEKQGQWRLIASPDGRDGSATVHQDMDLFVTKLAEGEALSYAIHPGRSLWLQVAKGTVLLDDNLLSAGDGVAVRDTAEISLRGASADAEILLFDLIA